MKNIIESESKDKINIENIGIFYNKANDKACTAAKETANAFGLRDINCRMLDAEEFSPNVTLAVILGGDGTILKAARYFAPYNVPVFGINLGRLGFLSQAKASQIKEAAECIIRGQFRIENRIMLSALGGKMTALNDIVVRSKDSSRTSRMYVSIDGHAVCDYLADGIIISTPTGSTAYNLSAGGAVLHPSLDAFAAAAICPHTLSARPIIIPSSEVVSISAGQNAPVLQVCADGQQTVDLPENQGAAISKSKYSAKLLLLNFQKNSFYSVLKEKLNWGFSWQG